MGPMDALRKTSGSSPIHSKIKAEKKKGHPVSRETLKSVVRSLKNLSENLSKTTLDSGKKAEQKTFQPCQSSWVASEKSGGVLKKIEQLSRNELKTFLLERPYVSSKYTEKLESGAAIHEIKKAVSGAISYHKQALETLNTAIEKHIQTEPTAIQDGKLSVSLSIPVPKFEPYRPSSLTCEHGFQTYREKASVSGKSNAIRGLAKLTPQQKSEVLANIHWKGAPLSACISELSIQFNRFVAA